MEKKRLGDLLVEVGCITTQQLQEALSIQRETKQKLGEILLEEGIVTEDQIIQTLEFQLGIPHVEIARFNIESKIAKLIPRELAVKYEIIPIRIERDKLVLAMSDPLNVFAIDDVKFIARMDVQPVIATRSEIKKAIEDNYDDQNMKKATQELNEEFGGIEDEENQPTETDDVANAPAVVLVNSIITQAIKTKASDIHIEAQEHYSRVRFRVDGELHEIQKFPITAHSSISTRIKIMSNLNIAEKRIPQDGRIQTQVDGKPVDLRVSILPTVFGEKIVIRILNRASVLVTIDKLGFFQDEMELIHEMISRPYGIILTTGPTGSGKSTTLYAVLNAINQPNRNIVTVEDPVEYMLEGINQVSVNIKAGLDFASALRSILRQDPDIVMIGEMRDAETAGIAVKAAITGHLVLSTLHTNDAPSSITRLIDMGVEPYMVTTAVVGVIAQRLVKVICPHCKEAYNASEKEKYLMGMKNETQDVIIYKGTGCPRCGGTGYKGRTGIREIFVLEQEHREMIEKGCTNDELKAMGVKTGMRTLKKACVRQILNGVTTVEELMRVAYTQEE